MLRCFSLSRLEIPVLLWIYSITDQPTPLLYWRKIYVIQKIRYEKVKVKLKVRTLVIAPLTWHRLVTSSALQFRKWQLIDMSQWCRSALCSHPLPALTDNWTHGAASRHTITPNQSHYRPLPRRRSYYSFPVPLRVGGWVGLNTQLVRNLLKLLAVDRVWVELATSRFTSPILYHYTTAPTVRNISIFSER